MRGMKLIKEQDKLRVFKIKNLKKILDIKKSYNLPIEVRIKKLAENDGLKIFLVDGHKIRHFIDLDFTMGGHGVRYVYVPMDEIWIDSSNKSEAEQIIVHEIHEFKLMKKGMDYGKAHESASIEEMKVMDKKLIIPVKHHRQINSWSCGPSSLKIVLDYYKDKRDIKNLIKQLKCTEKGGTLHKGFTDFLNKNKYSFKVKANASLKDIEEFLQEAVPVIVDYQAYHGGHFSVIIGYNKNRFLLSDASYDKKYKWVSKKDFLRRWFEEDEPGKIVKHWLLTVYRKKKI